MNNHASVAAPDTAGGPQHAADHDDYRRWRDAKLARYPRRAEELLVEVGDPRRLTASEVGKLRDVCRAANMAIYASPLAGFADRDLPRRLGQQLGLLRLDTNPLADDDGISSLQAMPEKSARGFIPYSNRRLLWHTDGYYNAPPQRIRAFILHCVRVAADGGVSCLLDHEIAYILLRDADPDYIRALSAADAMTIPANNEAGLESRPAQAGPVFSVDAASGCLHMRYTSRTRSIEWRQDEPTQAALHTLEHLLAGDSPYVLKHRLQGGQGLVCNNVLHNRSGFTDAPECGATRLIYRARYYDRIAGTAGAAARLPIAEGLAT